MGIQAGREAGSGQKRNCGHHEKKHKENYYILDTQSFGKSSGVKDDLHQRNWYMSGSWTAYSPLYEEKLAKDGISNLGTGFLLKKNVYIITKGKKNILNLLGQEDTEHLTYKAVDEIEASGNLFLQYIATRSVKIKLRKVMPKLYKKLIDIIALLCLAAVFLFTFSYLKSWWTEEIGEKRQEQNIWKEKRTGTWCTIKSNSLDGVPIYDEAGGSVPTGSLPEGKLCELTDSTLKEGKKWGKVKYAGLSGWMKMSYLKYICQESISIQEDSQIYINVSTVKGIRMYQEPDVTFDAVLKGIPYGAEFIVQETRDGWGKVSNNGRTGWINLYYAGCYPESSKAAWKVETLSSAQQINFREKPGEDQRSIAKVPENTYLEMKEFKTVGEERSMEDRKAG